MGKHHSTSIIRRGTFSGTVRCIQSSITN